MATHTEKKSIAIAFACTQAHDTLASRMLDLIVDVAGAVVVFHLIFTTFPALAHAFENGATFNGMLFFSPFFSSLFSCHLALSSLNLSFHLSLTFSPFLLFALENAVHRNGDGKRDGSHAEKSNERNEQNLREKSNEKNGSVLNSKSCNTNTHGPRL